MLAAILADVFSKSLVNVFCKFSIKVFNGWQGILCSTLLKRILLTYHFIHGGFTDCLTVNDECELQFSL